MKMNPKIIGRTAAFLLGGSALVATTLALDTKDSPGSPPAIILDTKPLDRVSSLPASFSEVIKRVSPSVVKIEVTGKAQPAASFGDQEIPPALRRFF